MCSFILWEGQPCLWCRNIFELCQLPVPHDTNHDQLHCYTVSWKQTETCLLNVDSDVAPMVSDHCQMVGFWMRPHLHWTCRSKRGCLDVGDQPCWNSCSCQDVKNYGFCPRFSSCFSPSTWKKLVRSCDRCICSGSWPMTLASWSSSPLGSPWSRSDQVTFLSFSVNKSTGERDLFHTMAEGKKGPRSASRRLWNRHKPRKWGKKNDMKKHILDIGLTGVEKTMRF